MRAVRLLTKPKYALVWLMVTGLMVFMFQSSFLPSVSYLGFGVVIFPVLLLFISAAGGILPALLALLLMVFGSRTVYGNGGILLAVYLLPVCAAFLVCLELKIPFFRTAAIVLAAFIISMVIVFGILQRQSGGNLYNAVAQAALDGLDSMSGRDDLLYTLWRSGFISHGLEAGSQVITNAQNNSWAFKPEVVEEFYKQISTRVSLLMAGLLPGMLTSYAISVSVPGMGLAVKLAHRYGAAPDLSMPPFSLWFLPKAAGKKMMVLAAGYIIAILSSNQVLQTAGQLMYNVFFALYSIQGLAFVNFSMKRRGTKPVLRLLLLLLLYLLLPPAAMLLGVFDQATDPRKLRVEQTTSNPL